MSSSDDGSTFSQGMMAFLPCSESDLPALTAPALKLLSRIQADQAMDLSVLEQFLMAQTLKELPDYTKLLIDGSLAGWYHLIRQSELLELDDVNILKAYRGKGFGTRILERVQSLSAELGLPVICRVQAGNENALRFYRRAGFQLVAREENHQMLRWPPQSGDLILLADSTQ